MARPSSTARDRNRKFPDVVFVEEEDREINPLGVKGIGEIGIVGTAAAITIDKLLRD
jgi:hypothetical protein